LHLAERRSSTPEQKADAVRLVRRIGSVFEVAKHQDLTETALREWGRQATKGTGPATAPALNAAEHKEIGQIRRDEQRLETPSRQLQSHSPGVWHAQQGHNPAAA
jgi:transposase